MTKHWERVKLPNGTYKYVLLNSRGKPVQYNENTGLFRVYDKPSTKTHSYETYLLPEQFNTKTKNTVNNNAPIQLPQVDVVASQKNDSNVGIYRTLDDHTAALMRNRAVDEQVNPQNDQKTKFYRINSWIYNYQTI